MNSKPSVGKKVLSFLGDNLVPIMFIIICAICIPVSGFSASYLINEIVTRMGRNIFLILPRSGAGSSTRSPPVSTS